jgi:hypothetical protein
VRRIVRRQVARGVDVQIEDVADDVRVFRAVQAVQPGRRRVRRRVPIELGFQPGDESVVRGFVGAPRSGRRHHSGAHLPDDALPDVGVIGDAGDVEIVERQLARRLLSGGL